MNKKQKEFYSFHEAGHTAIALMYNWDFQYVTIEPEPGYAGYLELLKNQHVGNFWGFCNAIEVLIAGGAANAIHLGKTLDEVSEGMQGDLTQILELYESNSRLMSKQEYKPFIQWIKMRVFVHLKQRWAFVEKLAEALQERKTLTCQECKEVMGLVEV